MKQERIGVFETNSSSTHSICISKSNVEPQNIPIVVKFFAGEYGWENRCVNDTASYLYTAILECGGDKYLQKLKMLLDELGIGYQFYPPEKGEWYGIDHGDNLGTFLKTILSDKDMLARFLFGDSCVYTGHDNQDYSPDGCDIAKETYWGKNEDGECVELPNPYHDGEHYDYFWKGN